MPGTVVRKVGQLSESLGVHGKTDISQPGHVVKEKLGAVGAGGKATWPPGASKSLTEEAFIQAK